jgi:hypothetical protein
MKLREILTLLEDLAQKNGISNVWIAGGIARAKAIESVFHTKNEIDVSDLDITTGDPTVHNLAKLFVSELSKSYDVSSKLMNDGHTSVYIGDFKVDFSSNFIDPNIDKLLAARGIKNPTPLQKEMFSRDFTCNALLLSPDMRKIKDPTKFGIKDIKAKMIRTCLSPDATFRSNPNRIIRVIYLAAKLGFGVDPSIIKWIVDNKQVIRASSDSYLTKNLNKAFKANPDIAIDLLNKTGLWDLVPITNEILPFYQKRHKTAQLFMNFDYADSSTGPGVGLYHGDMSKYKSVMDWRKKRRKRRAKTIKKILNTRPDRVGK